ncbi:carbamoyltransferase N-terminal domain-containing protein [Streptomyces sp. HD]|uniref:carbamoyltransferase N-terminal domain-containing protein n=1 Tax=Streptomyces sp. HD TaxID=3020892 RepID=UPI00232C7D75|nr:carbamoyltransferase N-terminal domain-containing protein [Streptomyces sp. HD]MDC0773376.1 carbamoyltransferase N-terminal domain-containing protein [Streptomyces sp. HD]
MITAGLKLTHSGGLALLEDDKLLFNIEVQKLANNARYSPVADLRLIPEILAEYGFKVSDVDHWALDGWDGAEFGRLSVLDHGTPLELKVAPYRENDTINSLVRPGFTGEIPIGGSLVKYESFVHMSSHFAAAYCSSPFAARGENSFVLVWDGGCFPRLYFVDAAKGTVENGGEVFPLIGHSYAMAAQYFGPWARKTKDRSQVVDDLSVAGKLMAYIALGQPKDAVQEAIRDTFHKHFEAPTKEVAEYRRRVIGCGSNGEPSHQYVHAYLSEAAERIAALGVSDEDVLASMHQFMEDLLVERIVEKIRRWKGDGPWNLSFAGGCALNIKWNSALRAHPLFNDVWVPPFPDDSGSAIGTACASYAHTQGVSAMQWHARLGPALVATPEVPAGWRTRDCSPAEVARILHESGKPLVFLRDRAELGPRALGARSILGTATDPAMKDVLNEVKDREYYRPVAPICLTEHAPEIFEPGTPDPYMLFDHDVRPDWLDKVPAITHLDGTARLQTVSAEDDPVLAEVLRAYHRLSGIPVLCNTSANLNGSGFFPDAASAMKWGRTDHVWADGVLYSKA